MKAILRCIRPTQEVATLQDDKGEELQEEEEEEDDGVVPGALLRGGGVIDVLAAVRAGDNDRLRELLEVGAQVNLSTAASGKEAGNNGNHVTPLHAAVELEDDCAMLTVLLQAKADVNAVSADGNSPMRLATKRNKGGALHHLHAAGAHSSADLVSLAVAAESHEALRMLLQAGADPSHVASDRPPVVKAALKNDSIALRILLEAGADPEQVDSEGKTPCIHSIDNSCSDALKVLLDFKVAAGIPLDTALLQKAAAQNNSDAVHLLIDAKADVNGVNTTTPVLAAVEASTSEYSVAALELLLAARADPCRVGSLPAPALVATMRNHLSALQILLDAKANPNEFSAEHESPVVHAINADDDRALRLLLKAGGNANLLQHDNASTPVTIALQAGYEMPLSLLLTSGGDANLPLPSGATPMSIATQSGDTGMMTLLLAAGGDPNQVGEGDSTPVYQAAQQESTDAFRLLLDYKGDVNHSKKDGTTLVFKAAAQDDARALRALLDARGDANGTRDGGSTPAFAATESGGTAALELLLQARADASHVADDGVSPVSVAAGLSHAEALCLLIAAGGDPSLARAAQAPKKSS